MRKRLRGPYTLILLLVLAGIGALYLHAQTVHGTAGAIVEALGTALIIAAVLAGTVDFWFKTQLLRDAFEATFGYLLPAELRAELTWIQRQEMVCVRHEQIFTLRRTDVPDRAILKVEVRRDERNVSQETQGLWPSVTVDRFFTDMMPRVISLGAATERERLDAFSVDVSHGFIVIGRSDDKIDLGPGEQALSWATLEQPVRENDGYIQYLNPATHGPRVTVDVPPGFTSAVQFGGHRESARVRRVGDNTFELPGTLLPGQAIEVRWWPNDAFPSDPGDPADASDESEDDGS